MAQDTARWFRLRDDIGLEPPYITDPETGQPVENPRAGELQPLHQVGVTLQIPTVVGDELVPTAQVFYVKPYEEGTRIARVDDPRVANVLPEIGFEEIDPPKQAQSRKPRDKAADGGEEA